VPAADVRVASAESLPFADAEFDAVLAQLVVNLVDDPPRAVGEMARVAQAGSVVAACFWDDDEMPLLRSLWDAARAIAPEALAGVNEQAQVGLSDVEVLREWWIGAGLGEVPLGEFEVAADYDDFATSGRRSQPGLGTPASSTFPSSLNSRRRSGRMPGTAWAHPTAPSAWSPKLGPSVASRRLAVAESVAAQALDNATSWALASRLLRGQPVPTRSKNRLWPLSGECGQVHPLA
jgi:SAM-dependent methyltransferase